MSEALLSGSTVRQFIVRSHRVPQSTDTGLIPQAGRSADGARTRSAPPWSYRGRRPEPSLQGESVTTSATRTPDVVATNTTSASAAPSAIESVDRERPSSHRESVLATALVGLVAAVVLFGLAFPELLAPAVAIAVLAAIVALDTLLPSGELRQMRENHWTF